MTMELRVLRPSEFDPWLGMLETAFGGVMAGEEREKWRALLDPDRAVGAWDGDEVVGSAGAFDFRMTVPGGVRVPVAGVTLVGVRPTHRRRGVLTSMMRRLLDDARSRGELFAVLLASEPDIYHRFGYGQASSQLRARIDTARVRLTPPPEADALRLRMVDPLDPDVRRECEELYARRVPLRPGMLERRPGWDQVPLYDPPEERHGASALHCVLAERDGEVRGYVRYATRPVWEASGPCGEVVLRDLEALDPAAHGALMRYLFGIDLTSWLVVSNRPVDDAWQYMVSDVRRCEINPRDQLHLRLVDLPGALAARRYAAGVDVVLDVRDTLCPWNAGRWRLTGGPGGATCARTEEAADLELAVDTLGAAYLGGPSLRALADAGRVREVREGALSEAAVAFGCDLAPWAPHSF